MPQSKDLAGILTKLNPVKYKDIIERAANNGYHDFKHHKIPGHPEYGECVGPKLQLATDLAQFPELSEIREQVIDGLYDESPDQDDQQEMMAILLEDNSPDAFFRSMGFPIPTKEERDEYKKQVLSEAEQNAINNRILMQLSQWVSGFSFHNGVDDMCCPDFSCCYPEIVTPLEKRQEFFKLYKEKGSEATIPMIAEFLKAVQGQDIHIIGAEPAGQGECAYCGQTCDLADLRPYGKDGVMICPSCSMKPENRETTDYMFAKNFR